MPETRNDELYRALKHNGYPDDFCREIAYRQMNTDFTATRMLGYLYRVTGPRAEDVVDEMLRVPDAASVATALWLETQLGRKVGASTGTNMWGVLQLAARMREEGRTGSIVTLLCDSGERYLESYYNPQWVADNIGDIAPWQAEIAGLVERR